MNTPKQEIEITQQDLREINARLSNFLKYYWERRALAVPGQMESADRFTSTIAVALVELEILKERMS